MLRDSLGLGAVRDQLLGGRDVQRLALERRNLLVDRAADDRMHEVEDPIGRENVNAGEGVGCARGGLLVIPGEHGGVVERSATQYRHRTRENRRVRRQ